MLVSSCPIFFGTQNSNRCQLLRWFKIQIVFNEPNYKTPRLCAVLYCCKIVVFTKKSLPLFMGETNRPFVSETNGDTPLWSSYFLFVWLLYVVEFASFFFFFKEKKEIEIMRCILSYRYLMLVVLMILAIVLLFDQKLSNFNIPSRY